MRHLRLFLILTVLLGAAPAAQAVDVNLINIEAASPEGQRMAQTFGKAYGFSPLEVVPAMAGPVEEVPAILRIAQAVGTLPLNIWMMRRLGMGYGDILTRYALSPAIFVGAPLRRVAYVPPPATPIWVKSMDPIFIQTARIHFLRTKLKVPVAVLPTVPAFGVPFARYVFQPPVGIEVIEYEHPHKKKWKHKKWKHKKWKHKRHDDD